MDSSGRGEDAIEEMELPGRAECPLEKNESAGDEVASDGVTV